MPSQLSAEHYNSMYRLPSEEQLPKDASSDIALILARQASLQNEINFQSSLDSPFRETNSASLNHADVDASEAKEDYDSYNNNSNSEETLSQSIGSLLKDKTNDPKASSKQSTSLSFAQLRLARTTAEDAIKSKKVFTIIGPYPSLRAALRRRGWVEQFPPQHQGPSKVKSTIPRSRTLSPDPSRSQKSHRLSESARRTRNQNIVSSSNDSSSGDDDDDDDDVDDDDICDKGNEHGNSVPPWEEENGFYGAMSRMVRSVTPTFIWTVKGNIYTNESLSDNQMLNHFKHGTFTSKVGLCTTLRNLPSWYESVCPDEFFPRCYRLSHEEERQMFIDDFFLTACISLLRRCVESLPATEQTEQSNNSKDDSINTPRAEDRSDCFNAVRKKRVDWAVGTALLRCEHHLKFVEHDDIDCKDFQLDEADRNKLLQAYYQISEGKLKAECSSTVKEMIEETLERLKKNSPQYEMEGTCNVWIVKPGAKSRGRGIQCYRRLEEMLKLVDALVGLSDNKYVVQKYIERPLLIYDTKFDIRQWFLITDWNPFTLWFYKSCYLRFCSRTFSLVNLDEATHLSNNAIQQNYENGVRHENLPEDNMWTKDQFLEYLMKERGFSADVWTEKIYPGMLKSVYSALICSQDNVESRKNSFALYGADFMLTEDLHPWLIEINSSPCMAPTTKVTAEMCAQVLEDMIKVVIDRKADKTAGTGLFELVRRHQQVAVPAYTGINLKVDGFSIKRPINFPQYNSPEPVNIEAKTTSKPTIYSNANLVSDSDDSEDEEEFDALCRGKKNSRRFSEQKRASTKDNYLSLLNKRSQKRRSSSPEELKYYGSVRISASQRIKQQKYNEKLLAARKKKLKQRQSEQILADEYLAQGKTATESNKENGGRRISGDGLYEDSNGKTYLGHFDSPKLRRDFWSRAYPAENNSVRNSRNAWYQNRGRRSVAISKSDDSIMSNEREIKEIVDSSLKDFSSKLREFRRQSATQHSFYANTNIPRLTESKPGYISRSRTLTESKPGYISRSRTLGGFEITRHSSSSRIDSRDIATQDDPKSTSAKYTRDYSNSSQKLNSDKAVTSVHQGKENNSKFVKTNSEPLYSLNLISRSSGAEALDKTNIKEETRVTSESKPIKEEDQKSIKKTTSNEGLNNSQAASVMLDKRRYGKRSEPVISSVNQECIHERLHQNTPVQELLGDNSREDIMSNSGIAVTRRAHSNDTSVIHISLNHQTSSHNTIQSRQQLIPSQKHIQLNLPDQLHDQQQQILRRAAHLRNLNPGRHRPRRNAQIVTSCNFSIKVEADDYEGNPIPSHHVSLVDMDEPLRSSRYLYSDLGALTTQSYNSRKYQDAWKPGGFAPNYIDSNFSNNNARKHYNYYSLAHQ